jgi:hypothetical protein
MQLGYTAIQHRELEMCYRDKSMRSCVSASRNAAAKLLTIERSFSIAFP